MKNTGFYLNCKKRKKKDMFQPTLELLAFPMNALKLSNGVRFTVPMAI